MQLTWIVATGSFLTGVSSAVTAVPDIAVEGEYYTGKIRISSGCGDSPTQQIEIDYDKELIRKNVTVESQSISGWNYQIRRVDQNDPKSKAIGITYHSYTLPSIAYGDFGISFKVPDNALLSSVRDNKLYFPVRQYCVNREWRNWINPNDKEFPAPEITLQKKSDSSNSSLIKSTFSLLILVAICTFNL